MAAHRHDEIRRHLLAGDFTVVKSTTFSNNSLSLIELNYKDKKILFVKKPFSVREAWFVWVKVMAISFFILLFSAGQVRLSTRFTWLLDSAFAH